eukprot:GHVP01036244.1.p1 GENE.GHVP01036244.1~~GHVP01036244.1.p1  ORF type:complete len:124 (-),score=9.15 GHVP01036244.1:192-563(-)
MDFKICLEIRSLEEQSYEVTAEDSSRTSMNQDGEEFEQAIRERIKSHIIHWSQWNRHHPIREFPTSVVPSFFYSRGNESLLLYDPRTPFLQKDPIPPSPIHTTEKCLAPRPSVPPTKFPCQIC